MKYFIIIILSIFCNIQGWTQPLRKADSLKAIANGRGREDSIQCVLYISIFRNCAREGDMACFESYKEKAEFLSKKLGNDALKIRTNIFIGRVYLGKANYLPSINFYNKGLDLALRINDHPNAAFAYLDLSALYETIADYEKALACNQNAIREYRLAGNETDVSSSYMNIAQVYASIKKPVLSADYAKRALKVFLAPESRSYYGQISANINLANNFLAATADELNQMQIKPENRYTECIKRLNEALIISKTTDEDSRVAQGTITCDLGNVYHLAGDDKSARASYTQAIECAETRNYIPDQCDIYKKVAGFYERTGDNKMAMFYSRKSLELAQSKGILKTVKENLLLISNIFAEENKMDSAYYYYKGYILVKEKIFNEENEKEITRKQLRLDFDTKEHEYKLIQQITDVKLKAQILLAGKQQQDILVQNQALLLAQKEKDLQRVTFLRNEVELQNAGLVKDAILTKTTLEAKLAKELSDRKIAGQLSELKAEKKAKMFGRIGLGIAFLVAGGIMYGYAKTMKLNKIIQKQNVELAKMDDVKNTLFSVVSHDLKAPVNSLISFIQLLEKGNLPPEKLQLYSTHLKNNLSTTSSLMNNLLGWASSQMKGFKTMPEIVDIRFLVNGILQNVQELSSQKNICIENNVPQNLILQTDKEMISAIFRNLLGNAIKFSPRDSTIYVMGKTEEKEICITVQDTGKGMSETVLADFNREQILNIKSSRGTENEKGTGLGLLLCKTFAQQLKGKLVLENNEKGLACHLYIPVSCT